MTLRYELYFFFIQRVCHFLEWFFRLFLDSDISSKLIISSNVLSMQQRQNKCSVIPLSVSFLFFFSSLPLPLCRTQFTFENHHVSFFASSLVWSAFQFSTISKSFINKIKTNQTRQCLVHYNTHTRRMMSTMRVSSIYMQFKCIHFLLSVPPLPPQMKAPPKKAVRRHVLAIKILMLLFRHIYSISRLVITPGVQFYNKLKFVDVNDDRQHLNIQVAPYFVYHLITKYVVLVSN